MRCKNLSEIKLPASLIYVNDNIFTGCESLEKISIPKQITTIDKFFFYKHQGRKPTTLEWWDECRLID